MRGGEPELRPLDVGGERGRFLVEGEGPPLVLLASQLVLARSYCPAAEELRRSFRVFTVELPGSGGGSRVAPPWDADAYASWVAGALDALHLDQVTLVGHSCSGLVALAVGALHPGHVGRLVLVGSIGASPRSLLAVLLGRGLDCLLEWNLTLRAWHHVGYNVLAHPRSFWHQVGLSARADFRPDAGRVRVPALLAWGAHDHTMPRLGAETLRSLLPDARLYISQEGSHDWLITHPHEFAAAVRAFVREAERVRGR
jgi:pimeloyl-ACP methyl ester carboxylesterase